MKIRFQAAGVAAAIVLSTAAGVAAAQTTVANAWVRGTVAQQTATGMFADVTSAVGGKLVGASSPAAGRVEIHQMKMEGDVMRMSAITALDLPAGKPVQLKPGGYHVMLMDLKQPLAAGQSVPVTLQVESADGKREVVEVKAEVRPLTAGADKADHGGMHGHKH